MHGWDDTHEAILSHKCDVKPMCINGGAQCAQELRVVRVRVRDGVLVIHRSVLKRDVVMREGVRNAVAIIVYRKMFVNMRCRVYSLYAGGTASHPGGRGGRTNVETRVSLCQYQIHTSSFLSPSLPDCTVRTSVPEVSLARVAVLELHRLDGVLQLSSWRGWARLGEQCRPRVRSQLRTFFRTGKSAKKPFTRLISALFNTSWRMRRR